MQETPAKTHKAAVAGTAADQLQVSRYGRASGMLLALSLTR
ncbi:MAG: hypothetical protein WCB27_11405 [Thermoguttaceae bacterium]|jgi:hypothetical protein